MFSAITYREQTTKPAATKRPLLIKPSCPQINYFYLFVVC